MLLHAIHADTRFGDMNVKGRIIFKSSDTDILLLCTLTFEGVKFFVVDGSENKPAR
jgi:hypothetical protein